MCVSNKVASNEINFLEILFYIMSLRKKFSAMISNFVLKSEHAYTLRSCINFFSLSILNLVWKHKCFELKNLSSKMDERKIKAIKFC